MIIDRSKLYELQNELAKEQAILELMDEGGRIRIAKILNENLDYAELSKVCSLINYQKSKIFAIKAEIEEIIKEKTK